MKKKTHPRIGFHTSGSGGNPRGIGDKYVKRLHDAGIPVAITCADGIVGIGDALANPHPDDVLIFRVVRDGSERYAVPDYGVSPGEAARKSWDSISPFIGDDVTRHKDQIWLAYGNELNAGNARWIFEWSLEMARLLNGMGFKAVGPNWASGTPDYPAWETEAALNFLRYCADNPDKAAVGIHEYSYEVDDLFAKRGDLVGRYRHIVKVCQQNNIGRPTILIKEFGYTYNAVPEPSRMVDDLRKLFELYPDYPPATLWYLGSGYGGIANLLQPAIGNIGEFVAGHEVEVDLAASVERGDTRPGKPKGTDEAGVSAPVVDKPATSVPAGTGQPKADTQAPRTYTPPSQITISAQPHLRVRREPMISPDNIVGQLPDGSTWPVVGVARDGFSPDAGVLWAQIEFTEATTGQSATGFCRSDFFSPQPDPLPATQRVLPDDGLNLRSSPAFDKAVNNKIVTMPGGSVLRVLGGVWEKLDPRIGKWWFYVDFGGQRGYAYARYLGD
jgi:hypothetical protein